MMYPKRSGKYRNYKRPNSSNSSEDPLTKIEVPNYLPNYVCPKCKLYYDFHATADGSYVGRVPLVLDCKHTMCGECIRKDAVAKTVICVECNSSTDVPNNDKSKKINELFPINFYIFGVLMYYRQKKQTTPNLSFKPSGQVWNQGKPGAKCSTTSSESAVTTMSVGKCSQKDCGKEATVNCPDCDETFCDNCASVLHSSAKGLMKHKYTRLLQGTSPELTMTCTTHKGSVIEFHCKNCDISLCCYCVLLSHKDHEYVQLTEMNEEDVNQVSGLVLEAEALLVKLEKAEKKISKYMDQNMPSSSSKNNIDVEICRFFENMHATLQTLEKQLHRDVIQYKEMRFNSLVAMRKDVVQNINSITNLISSARQAINNDGDIKLDVRTIKEGLQKALTSKCHVVYEDSDVIFEHGDAISELEDTCRIRHSSINNFVLVNADDVPSNYEDTFSDESSVVSQQLSTTNYSASCSKNTETSDSNAGKSTDYLNNWLQQTNGFAKTLKSPPISNDGFWEEPKTFEIDVPTLNIGDKERVTVSHINTPESFYVQLTRATYPLMVLNQRIEKAMQNKQSPVPQPEALEIYLVLFKMEKFSQWYRARVTHTSFAENKFDVFYIDYGNTAVVPRKWIRHMPEELAKIPPFGIECKIYDIYPKQREWDRESTNLIASIVKDIEVLMIIVDKSIVSWEVDLITMDGDTSIRDALIFIGAGTPQLQEHDDIIKAKKDMSSSLNKVELYPFSKQFQQYDEVRVIITAVTDPHHLYVSLADCQENLLQLKENMRTHYVQHPKGFLYAPKEDMPVAVDFANTWYRGTIVTPTEGKKQLEIFFVDVGMTTWVDWSNVRKLHEKFMRLECQAFRVKMMHVKPVDGTWPHIIMQQFFMPYISEKTILKMVIGAIWEDDSLEVALFEVEPTVHYSVNAKLVQAQCAESDGQLGTELEWPQCPTNLLKTSFTIDMMKLVQTEQQQPENSSDEDITTLIRKEVEIVSVVDPSCIYVRFLTMTPRQAKFYADMQKFYASVTVHKKHKWSPGNLVVVKRDNHFHRGLVLESLPDGTYKIELRDIGDQFVADAQSVYRLEEYFANFPEFVTRCHLANILPAGDSKKWPRLAVEFLTDILNSKTKFMLTKCGKIDMERCSFPVIMWYTEFQAGGPLQKSKTILHSINNSLMRNGLALKSSVQLVFPENEPESMEENVVVEDIIEDDFSDDDNIPLVNTNKCETWLERPPFEEEHFVGVATFVDENGYIYVQDSRDKDRLEAMQEKINKFSSHFKYIPHNWQVGELCLAKYFLDNSWYRARITNITPNAMKVVMIDYGNEEDVKDEDLNHHILFHDVPSFAGRVCLADIHPKNNSWTTSDLDMLHGAIVEKTIQVTLIDKTANPQSALIKCENVLINSFILNASSNFSIQNLQENEDDSGSEDVIVIEEDTDEELEYKQREMPVIPEGKLSSVRAINVQTYRTFVLDFGLHNSEENAAERLNVIQADIMDIAPSQPCISKPSKGMPCIALFSGDNLYYRGIIQEDLGDKISVYFVDFGNTENVDAGNVRKTKREFVEGYPLDYVVATIDGVVAVDPNHEDILKDYMEEEVVPLVTWASITNYSPLTVQLFKKDKITLAYEGLFGLGLIKRC